MKNLKVPHQPKNNGYPMYFQMQKEGANDIIDIAHNDKVEIGDTFQTQAGNGSKIWNINKIIEQRKPGLTGKNNHPDNVMWYRVCANEIEYKNSLHAV